MEIYWAEIITILAKDGVMDYDKLKRIDVFEFYKILVVFQKQIKQRKEINSKLKENG